jgi:hypothetical protein
VPTIVQFVGGESLTLDDDFDRVNQQLGHHDAGLFNRLVGRRSRASDDLQVERRLYPRAHWREPLGGYGPHALSSIGFGGH